MGDLCHLSVPTERNDEVGMGCRQHCFVVGKGRRITDLGGSPRDETRVRILDGDQLHVRHRDEVAQVGGVVESMPVAYLDRGDANWHEKALLDVHWRRTSY